MRIPDPPRALLAAALAASALASAPAAQEPPSTSPPSLEEEFLFEDEVVYAAGKREEPAVTAPATVTVIGAEEIRRHGYRTVPDALRSVMGVFVSNDQTYEYVAIRGWAPPGDFMTRILVLIDGHPVNEWVSSSSTGIYETLPIEIVERIEVVRGPASVLYGTNAFFGVLNIVTKAGADLPGLRAFGEVGSWRARGGGGAVGGKVGETGSLLLSGKTWGTEGDVVSFDGLGRSDEDYERQGTAFLKYADGEWTVLGRWGRRVAGLPGAPYGANFDSPENRYVDRLAFGEVRWTPSSSEDFCWSFRAFADDYAFDDFFDYSPSPDFRDEWDAVWWGGEAAAFWRFAPAHLLTAGAEAIWVRTRLHSFDVGSAPVIDDRREYYTYRIFAEDRVELGKGWTLLAGVQGNLNQLFENAVSPHGGLLWAPRPGTVAKLLAGEGFRNPSVGEAFYDDGFTTADNPSLRPERIRTVELSLEHALDERHAIQLAVFRNGVEDQILQSSTAGGLLQFQNRGDVAVYGLEVGARGRRASGVEAFANGAFYSDGGADLVNFPDVVAHAGVSFPLLPPALEGFVRGSYVSRRPDRTGGWVEPFFQADAIVHAKDVLGGVDLWLGAWNLLDAPIDTAVGSEFVPRSVRVDGRFVGLRAEIRF